MKNYSWILSCSLSASITYYLLKNDIPHHIFGKDVKEFKFSDLFNYGLFVGFIYSYYIKK